MVTETATDPAPWFTLNTSSPFAFFKGVVSPVSLSPNFENAVNLAKDQLARPHDTAPKDRLEAECRAVADLLVQVAAEDGHSILLARAMQAMVVRIAENETAREAGIESKGESND